MAPNSWLSKLQQHGYRPTQARRAVIETVASSPSALTPIQVYDLARQHYPALGLVTVYRTLEKLEELALVERVHQPAGCQAFITAGRGHQHLMLCQQCGQTVYFEGDDLDTLIASISRQTGYEVRDHWLQLFGLCSQCKQTHPAE
jgi:Fe2+ or Zn2+ uptake regulation protein